MTRVDGRAPGAPRPGGDGPRATGGAPAGPREHLAPRGKAYGLLGSFLLFATGFAVSAGLEAYAVLTGTVLAGQVVYLAGLGVGLVALLLVAFFMRGVLYENALWSPGGLCFLARSARLPELPVVGVIYVLGVWGLVGNIVIPVFVDR